MSGLLALTEVPPQRRSLALGSEHPFRLAHVLLNDQELPMR